MNHIFVGWKDLSRDDVYRITVGISNLAFVKENILINVLYNLYCSFKQMNQINLGWNYRTAMSEGFAYIIFVWPCLWQLSLLDWRSWYIVINFTILYRRVFLLDWESELLLSVIHLIWLKAVVIMFLLRSVFVDTKWLHNWQKHFISLKHPSYSSGLSCSYVSLTMDHKYWKTYSMEFLPIQMFEIVC